MGKKFLKFKPKLISVIPYGIIGVFSSPYFVLHAEIANRFLWLAYLSYIGGACSLFFLLWSSVYTLKKTSLKDWCYQLTKRNTFTKRFVTDFSFRAVFFAYGSLITTIALAIIKAWMGIRYFSIWFGLLAGYYIIISIARFQLLKSHRKLGRNLFELTHFSQEWTSYKVSGFLLLTTTIFLEIAIIFMVYNRHVYHYHGMLIYLMAFYDFSCLTKAIHQMFRLRKQLSPIIKAIKILSFSTSLVSLLSLQSAMFVSFGSGTNFRLQQLMNFITGTSICSILCLLGAFMVRKGTREYEKLKGESL